MTPRFYRWFEVINTEGLDSEAAQCLHQTGFFLRTEFPDLAMLQFSRKGKRLTVHVFRTKNLEEKILCLCGCLRPVGRAKSTSTKDQLVCGEYLRYIKGHNNRRVIHPGDTRTDPNPSGKCCCGCGTSTGMIRPC